MEIRFIDDLAKVLKRHGLTGLELEQAGECIRLTADYGTPSYAGKHRIPEDGRIPSEPADTVTEYESLAEEAEQKSPAVVSGAESGSPVDGETVNAPMVGTYYSKPSPEADPFVQVGDRVRKGQVLCILEAMKLMNEIEAPFEGEIVEICATDEELIEYGQPLFRIRR